MAKFGVLSKVHLNTTLETKLKHGTLKQNINILPGFEDIPFVDLKRHLKPRLDRTTFVNIESDTKSPPEAAPAFWKIVLKHLLPTSKHVIKVWEYCECFGNKKLQPHLDKALDEVIQDHSDEIAIESIHEMNGILKKPTGRTGLDVKSQEEMRKWFSNIQLVAVPNHFESSSLKPLLQAVEKLLSNLLAVGSDNIEQRKVVAKQSTVIEDLKKKLESLEEQLEASKELKHTLVLKMMRSMREEMNKNHEEMRGNVNSAAEKFENFEAKFKQSYDALARRLQTQEDKIDRMDKIIRKNDERINTADDAGRPDGIHLSRSATSVPISTEPKKQQSEVVVSEINISLDTSRGSNAQKYPTSFTPRLPPIRATHK